MFERSVPFPVSWDFSLFPFPLRISAQLYTGVSISLISSLTRNIPFLLDKEGCEVNFVLDGGCIIQTQQKEKKAKERINRNSSTLVSVE